MGLKCSGREDSTAEVLPRKQGGCSRDALERLRCTRMQLWLVKAQLKCCGSLRNMWSSEQQGETSVYDLHRNCSPPSSPSRLLGLGDLLPLCSARSACRDGLDSSSCMGAAWHPNSPNLLLSRDNQPRHHSAQSCIASSAGTNLFRALLDHRVWAHLWKTSTESFHII